MENIIATDLLKITSLFIDEVIKAKEKHPNWPTDPVHAAAILGEESGELTQAALDFYAKGGDELRERMSAEAIQCGAMSIRFLLNVWQYRDSNSAVASGKTDIAALQRFVVCSNDEGIERGLGRELTHLILDAISEIQQLRGGTNAEGQAQ